MRVAARALIVAMALAACVGVRGAAGQTAADEQAILQFERAADAYAFKHRQVEGRLGAAPDSAAMAKGMKAERPSPVEGTLFTPLIANTFRHRIQPALGKGRCAPPDTGSSSIVPRPNDAAVGTMQLSECLVAALPKLPPELQYRSAGVALVLVDVHAGLVVDVLHGAFPVKN